MRQIGIIFQIAVICGLRLDPKQSNLPEEVILIMTKLLLKRASLNNHRLVRLILRYLQNKRSLHEFGVRWCCICKKKKETADHLLLHYKVARAPLNDFDRVGLAWVIPRRWLPYAYCGAFGGKGTIEIPTIMNGKWMNLKCSSSTLCSFGQL